MLRSRSKRPDSWGCHGASSELPMSKSSSSLSSVVRKHRLSESPCRRGSETVRISRCLKLLSFLVALLVLFVVLYIWGANIPGSRYRAQYFTLGASKANHSLTMESQSKPDSRSLPRGKPPMVDRSILDKLAMLDQSAEDSDEPRFSSPRNKYAWPPAVTRIPEPQLPNIPSNVLHHQFQHEPISTASLAEFDFSICGTDTCRFILPLRIAEQESKARLHFLQILELAGSLNRTVVLPNVGKSRMGMCFRWNFGKYYDAEALQARPDHKRSSVIDTENFRRWTATRPIKANAQIVSINSRPRSGILSSETLFFENGVIIKVEQDQDPSDPQHARCLNSKFPRLGLDAYSPLSIYPSKGLKNKPFGTKIVDALLRKDVRSASFRGANAPDVDSLDDEPLSPQDQEEDQDRDYVEHSSDPDVLILDYDLRHPAFSTSQFSPTPLPALHYAPNLTALAANLIASLEPADYLAIHWRMETVPPHNLVGCAESLVHTLAALLQRQGTGDDAMGTHNTKTVWFASDYPYPISRPFPLNVKRYQTQKDGGSKSGTFRGIGLQHEEAIEKLRGAFDEGGALEGRRLTGLTEELVKVRAAATEGGKVGIEGELNDDSGILGILDKLVAIRAGLFVSGGKGCGRTSSFTKQIVDARQAEIDKGSESIENNVEYFG